MPSGKHGPTRIGIYCTNDTRIEVEKVLEIVSGYGSTALVQTIDYSYNAVLNGRGNIFRYIASRTATTGLSTIHITTSTVLMYWAMNARKSISSPMANGRRSGR